MSDKQLLIPIKVEALVIEEDVINIDDRGRRKWSLFGPNYDAVLKSFERTRLPFFDAKFEGKRPQLQDNSKAVEPGVEACGVYLHWLLPQGLRHAHRYEKDHVLEYPPLPDRWLVCRFARRTAAEPVETKAWVIDSSIIGQAPTDFYLSPNLIVKESTNNYLTAVKVGEHEELAQFSEKTGDRIVLTAVGNEQTGSPLFTASVAENRDMLSFHDTLQDLRPGQDMAKEPQVASICYLVLGSYRDAAQEPFKYVPTVLAGAPQPPKTKPEDAGYEQEYAAYQQELAAAVLEALQWQIGPDQAQAAPLPNDLLAWRCLFHGQIAHINFWGNQYNSYGYPGAKDLKLGIGNSPADALIALLAQRGASAQAHDSDAALWKALEMVVYHQSDALLKGWSETPREFEVHQSWFTSQFGGLRWTIAPEERDANSLAVSTKVNGRSEQSFDPQPSEAQLTALQELNAVQKKANAAARELAALQQDTYAAWWSLCYDVSNGNDFSGAQTTLQAFTAKIDALRGSAGGTTQQLQPLVSELSKQLVNLESLLKDSGLRLLPQGAPRFYTPKDPVIAIQNVGHQLKHEFPNPLICRQTDAWLDKISFNAGQGRQTISPKGDLDPIKNNLNKPFGDEAVRQTMSSLLDEAALIEEGTFRFAAAVQAGAVINDSAAKSLHEFLQAATTTEPEGPNWIAFSDSGQGDEGLLRRLVRFWEGQPWSPLYMDWLIEYRPQHSGGADFLSNWRKEAFDYLVENENLGGTAYLIHGRSIMNPVAGRFFSQPIDDLLELLTGKPPDDENKGKGTFDPRLHQILKGFADSWQDDLEALLQGGLLGQTLSGVHQTFLERDTFNPQLKPNLQFPFDSFPDFPQQFKDEIMVSADGQGGKYLDPPLLPPGEQTLSLTSVAPPGNTAPDGNNLPFTLLRGGSFSLEALWIVDDFGQFLPMSADDVVMKISPHCAWPNKQDVVAMPPRFVQPARLDFRFVSTDFGQISEDHPHTHPVCGWVFHNMIDQALTLCAGDGRLLGELALIDEGNNQVSARFIGLVDSDASGSLPRANTVEDLQQIDDTLYQFAKVLVSPAPGERHPLQDLLLLIDQALGNIRTGMGNRYQFAGRPLALVNATLGLELFGRAWTKPGSGPAATAGSGNAELDKVKIPVRLGHEQMKFDGLIGYYQRGAGVPMDKIYPVSPISDPTITAEQLSGYVNNKETEALVDFGPALQLTLLMDPLGLVHADSRVLPGKVLQLPERFLKSASKHLEFSFRVAPALLRIPTPAAAETVPESEKPVVSIPVPTGMRGKWSFSGPVTQQTEIDAAGPAGKPDFTPWLPLAAEGRLTLRTNEKQADVQGQPADNEKTTGE